MELDVNIVRDKFFLRLGVSLRMKASRPQTRL